VGTVGDWSLSVIGRNLKTWTDYEGFDPEVGIQSTISDAGSGLIADPFGVRRRRHAFLSLLSGPPATKVRVSRLGSGG
jgi:hypothetical protein